VINRIQYYILFHFRGTAENCHPTPILGKISGGVKAIVQLWVCLAGDSAGPKSVHAGNGLQLIALPVTMPLRIVNHSCSGFPCNCKWRYTNVV